MTGYTKLFSSIVGSTIWTEDDRTRIVWITMLAIANQHGEVEASIPGLAKFASVPIADAEKALATLSSPDPYSRSKEFEGRRIEVIDGGWVILNYAKYRERASADDRRERDRIRQQRNRQTKRAAKTSAPVTPASASVTQSHDKQSQKSEADSEALTERTGDSLPRNRPRSIADVVRYALTEIADTYKPASAAKWVRDVNWQQPVGELLDAISEDCVREWVAMALRFVRYNNSQGWQLKSWKLALRGFNESTANTGASDVPADWVPRIESTPADEYPV